MKNGGQEEYVVHWSLFKAVFTEIIKLKLFKATDEKEGFFVCIMKICFIRWFHGELYALNSFTRKQNAKEKNAKLCHLINISNIWRGVKLCNRSCVYCRKMFSFVKGQRQYKQFAIPESSCVGELNKMAEYGNVRVNMFYCINFWTSFLQIRLECV